MFKNLCQVNVKRKIFDWFGMGSGLAFKRGGWLESCQNSQIIISVKTMHLLAGVLFLLYRKVNILQKSKYFTEEFESFNVKHLRPGWSEAISHFELHWR